MVQNPPATTAPPQFQIRKLRLNPRDTHRIHSFIHMLAAPLSQRRFHVKRCLCPRSPIQGTLAMEHRLFHVKQDPAQSQQDSRRLQ